MITQLFDSYVRSQVWKLSDWENIYETTNGQRKLQSDQDKGNGSVFFFVGTLHYSDGIISAMVSQITGVPIFCSTVC